MEECRSKVNCKLENLLSDNEDDDDHIKFKGIPINGTVQQVRAKIINAGFVPDGEPLVGKFAGLKVKVYVGGDDETNLAYSVIVVSDEEKSWDTLKQKFLKVRELYIQKYGEPTKDMQTFGDPYYEGEGDELEATECNKCLYNSSFTVPGGEVSIFIINRSIMFSFDDAINKPLEEDEDNDYEDFDEDYDA